MAYDPRVHDRQSMRLHGFDYSAPGPYFVTVCVEGRRCILGDVVQDEMQLSGSGQLVQQAWDEMPAHYPGVILDQFQVMPNHIHGILGFSGLVTRAGRIDLADAVVAPGPRVRPLAPRAGPGIGGLTLPDVLQRFKSWTDALYRRHARRLALPNGTLWQRGYYDHVIRTNHSLQEIREYIFANPERWHLDTENPAGTGGDDFAMWVRRLRDEGRAQGPAPTGDGGRARGPAPTGVEGDARA